MRGLKKMKVVPRSGKTRVADRLNDRWTDRWIWVFEDSRLVLPVTLMSLNVGGVDCTFLDFETNFWIFKLQA